ncbi:maltodextrose utilization protein MalA [Ligilactobacillus ruminis]|uniref:maltodextrose utilization protein MalA n=1 Tax=Ligilactobacillus ruminis TaxID=1623 RepID=UPI003B9982C9
MKDAFPANYFASWTSPVKMFTNRKSMKWWQLILVFVFLFALVLTPVPLYYQQKTTVDIGEYMPEVSQMLNDKELQQIAKTASYSKDEYSFKNSQVLKNEKGRLMGINLPKKQVNKAKSAVVMCDKFFYLRDRKVTYKIFYNEKYAPNEGKLKDQLVKTWYLRNKAAIAFSMMFLVGSMFLMTDVLIILVGSIFLWLARKSPMVTIESFKEAVNVMLNVLGPASLVAFVFGTLHFDLSLMTAVQSAVAIILMLVVYTKTHFNDYYVEKRK